MRTFIALELPTDFSNDIAALARILQESVEGRFMERTSYHLTLAFLGDIDEHTSQEVVTLLNNVCREQPPIELTCKGMGTFGRPQDCTLWLDIAPQSSLMQLVANIRTGLKTLGISFDQKPFKPHITLARRAHLEEDAILPNLPFPRPNQASTVTLFKSTLNKEGAIYKPLFSKTLIGQTSDPHTLVSPIYSAKPILSVPDVIRLENMIAADGIPLAKLMHTAGVAVANAVIDFCSPPANICVLAGTGNNGGDGWIAAYELAKQGYTVNLITFKHPEALTAEPGANTAQTLYNQTLQTSPTPSIVINPSSSQVQEIVQNAAVIIDSLLGTGFSGESIKEPYATWITHANSSHQTQLAISVDVPSGLNAQTGIAATPTFRADKTITMLAFKPGLLVPNAAQYCGEITLASLIDTTPYLEAIAF